MLDRIKIISVTHKTISLKDIKHFVVSDDAVMPDLQDIKQNFGLTEIYYLSTCNRVLYMFVDKNELVPDFAREFFNFVRPDMPSNLIENFDQSVLQLQGQAAIKHLLEVAASIDSLVIGEREILRQLREAYDKCKKEGLTGDTIRMTIEQAIVAAKAVYANTRIGEKPVSVVSLAIRKLLETHLPKTAKILLVGAGQTNKLVAKFLAKHQFNNISVFNRTLTRAEQVVEISGGQAYKLEQLDEYQDGFDCMIVCTGSNDPIISARRYRKLIGEDKNQKVIIDLAIPHNVEKAVINQFPVHYIEIEGLKSLASDNLAFREREVVHAQNILEQELEKFGNILRQREVELALRVIPSEVKAVKQKAIQEVFRQEIDSLDESSRDLLERVMSYMEKKCISIPMKAAREALV